MQLANNHNIDLCQLNEGYHDALFRQIHSNATYAFGDNIIPGKIYAVDYDYGRLNAAYFDQDYANYYISDGGDRVAYNAGGQYRNDGVDIVKTNDTIGNGFAVSNIEAGEWLKFTLDVQDAALYKCVFNVLPINSGGEFQVFINDSIASTIKVPYETYPSKWTEISTMIDLPNGKIPMKINFIKGGFEFSSIEFLVSEAEKE